MKQAPGIPNDAAGRVRIADLAISSPAPYTLYHETIPSHPTLSDKLTFLTKTLSDQNTEMPTTAYEC